MKYNNIKPIRKIEQFSFFAPKSVKIGEAMVGNEIQFPPRSMQQSILIEDDVLFMITNDTNQTEHFRIDETTLGKKLLLDISSKFNFSIVPHQQHPNISMGSLGFKHNDYNMLCYGAIQRKEGKNYILIYAKRGSTVFEDDILYVHGIWEVELS